MWQEPAYRSGAGGVPAVKAFAHAANIQPEEHIVEFGCGQGKAYKHLKKFAAKVTLVDIADNSLDDDIPREIFIRHDLSEPLDLQADVGFCIDTMEHFPTHQIDSVLANIFSTTKRCYFLVSTHPDGCGKLIGETLHLTVKPFTWWKQKFSQYGAVTLLTKNTTGFTVIVANET